MKTRYKITGVVFGILVIGMIVMMYGTICILVDEGSPNDWLGSIDGCGPLLTYQIHQYFGIFW